MRFGMGIVAHDAESDDETRDNYYGNEEDEDLRCFTYITHYYFFHSLLNLQKLGRNKNGGIRLVITHGLNGGIYSKVEIDKFRRKYSY